MINISNYKTFTRANGTSGRNNHFSFELLCDTEFRKAVRNNKELSTCFRNMEWVDNKLLENVQFLIWVCNPKGEYISEPCDTKLWLGISGYSDYRISTNEEKRCSYIVYSREGHPNVRETAAKLWLKSLKESGLPLPARVANRLAELFAIEWQAYVESCKDDYTLHVDNNFQRIYSSDECVGDFHSCMEDKPYCALYEKTTAQAVYLLNKENKIVARAILWKCYDDNGAEYDYLDRQYSSNNKDELKKQLIDSCIQAGLINCYKPVNCCCSDSDNIVDLQGNRIQERLHINLSWEGEKVPYFDTFKYYVECEEVAYSTAVDVDYNYEFTTTNGWPQSNNRVWSEFHDMYIDEEDAIYIEGAGYYSIEDDGEYIAYTEDDEWQLIDDCYKTEDTRTWWHNTTDLYYCYDTENYYESDSTLYYAEDEGQYYEYSDDLYYCKDTKRWFANEDSLFQAVDTDEYYEYSNNLFYTVDTCEYYAYSKTLFYCEETAEYYTTDEELVLRGDKYYLKEEEGVC